MDISTAFKYCQEKAAKSNSSFYYSFLLLPISTRQAMFNLYAFCREVDDIVDECSDAAIAMQKLSWWRQEIMRCFATQTDQHAPPSHPIAIALQHSIQNYPLELAYFIDILDGMQQDLQQTRYLDFLQLEQYCWRVAGAVGTLSAHIFGFAAHNQAAVLAYAKEMGLALQLMNIIRDVGEDARRGRIYLPINDLQAHQVPAHEIINYAKHQATDPELAEAHQKRLTHLLAFQAQRAQHHYQEALRILPKSEYKNQRPGLMMGALYNALLVEIMQANYPVLTHKTTLPTLRKMSIVAKIWLKYAWY